MIIAEDLNTCLSVIDRSSRKSVKIKEMFQTTLSINFIKLTSMELTTQNQQKTHSSQVHMEQPSR